MKTPDLARYLGVSSNTIRNWTNEFKDYLSNAATNVNARQRIYNDRDVLVIGTIAQLSGAGSTYSEVHSKLSNGYRIESLENVAGGIDTRVIPAAAVEQMIDATEVRLELERVSAERDKLLDMVQGLQTQLQEEQERFKAELEAARNEKTEELTKRQEQVETLLERVGRAEAQVELLKELLKKD